MAQPYHVYLDLDVLNNDVASGARPHQLVFEETRNTPFLDGDASNYFCSIVRFSVQTGSSLPVFIPRINDNQTPPYDPNETEYKVTLTYYDYVETATLIYTPAIDDNVQFWKVGYLAGQDTTSYASSGYYHVKNYQNFIRMVNNTLRSCFLALRQRSGTALNGTYPPFLEWDPNSLKCILNADAAFYNLATVPNSIKIYFNSRLFQLFSTFQNKFIDYAGDMNYQLVVHNNNGVNLNKLTNNITIGLVTTATTLTFVQMYQEASTVSLWNPVASLVFCSTMLPICPTQTSKPNIISNQNNNLSSGGDNSNLTNILSDFEVAIQDTNSYRPLFCIRPRVNTD
jgi:hypothetical protein